MKSGQQQRSRLTELTIILLVGLVFVAIITGNRACQQQITVSQAGDQSSPSQSGVKGLALGLWLQFQANEINTALGTDSNPVPFSIEPGESVLSVANQLKDLNLIEDEQLFRRFLQYNGLDQTLEAGEYTLSANMTMKEIGLALQEAQAKEIAITIPEGWRAEQIAESLTAEGVMDGGAFLAAIQSDTAVRHPILIDRPANQTLEGYLYPDTYRLPLDVTPNDLIMRMLDNLANKLPPDTQQLAAEQNLNFYEVLTIAAIVEREAVVAEERPTIASVYLNRLGPNSPRSFLEADPTVQYAMGYQVDKDQWWKTPVTLAEYQDVDSPYNTYLYPGLPPGPIANPGIASITAVLKPDDTAFYFFVCREPGCKGGEHVFARTYDEHLANVKRYYGQ